MFVGFHYSSLIFVIRSSIFANLYELSCQKVLLCALMCCVPCGDSIAANVTRPVFLSDLENLALSNFEKLAAVSRNCVCSFQKLRMQFPKLRVQFSAKLCVLEIGKVQNTTQNTRFNLQRAENCTCSFRNCVCNISSLRQKLQMQFPKLHVQNFVKSV